MKRNEEKIQCLKRQMEDYAKKDVIVAFSGGVDSSLLLKLACEAALKSKRKVYAAVSYTQLDVDKRQEWIYEYNKKADDRD